MHSLWLRQWRYAAALALTALTLFGCADDDDGPTSERSTTGAEATPEPETPTTSAADERIAQDVQLRLEDFPTGWQQRDESDDDEPEESPCDAIEEARGSTTARGESPEFSEGENTQAQSIAYVYSDERDASQAFDGLASDETRDCIGQYVADELTDRLAEQAATGSDLELGDESTGRVSIDPLGDEHEAIRVQVPISSEGIDVDLYIDAAYIRVGRGISLLTTSDVLSPFDDELRAELMSKLVRRLSASLEK